MVHRTISAGRRSPAGMSEGEYDYLIVGAAAAGCVLAARLSADPRIRVLLIEPGADAPPGQEHPAIRDPHPLSMHYPAFVWPALTAEVGANPGNGASRLSRNYLQGRGVG